MRAMGGHTTSFVGRASTLRRLDWWLADAMGGSPRLGIITGEPGMGKSRVVAEWLSRSCPEDSRVLVGSCREHVEFPLLPLATALELVPGATQCLFPPESSSSSSGGDLRRFLGAARILVEASAHRPTVLVLHDMHWADPVTLDFVAQLMAMATRASATDPVQLLVVLTVRPSEGSEKVQSMLRRLRLEPSAGVDHLSGLNELEVNELLEGMLPTRPSRQLVRGVLDATNGNPLLIILLVDRLQAERQLVVSGRRSVSRSDPERLVVPSELETAWQLRLDRLPTSDRVLLEIAALLGDGSPTDYVRVAADVTDAELEDFFDRAERAGLLTELDECYRFDHPHLRTALVAAMPSRHRSRWEGDIATRLWARYHDVGGTHLLAILQHLRRAGSNVVMEDIDTLRLAAAAEASARGMWAEAAAYYEDVLAVLAPSTEPSRRAVLELRAGQAHHRNQDFELAVPHHLAAIALAKEVDDLPIWGEALFWLAGADVLERAGGGYYDDRLVSEFLERAGDEFVGERALLLAYRAQHEFGRFDAAAGLEAITEATRLSRQSERPEIRHFVAHIEGVNRLGVLNLAGAESSFCEAIALNDDHTDPWLAVWPHVGLPLVHLAAGDLAAADQDARLAVDGAADNFQWNLHGLALALRAGVALGQGRVADARHYARLGVQSYHRSDFFYAGAIAYPHLVACHAYVGDHAGALVEVGRWRDRVGRLARIHALLVEAICGPRDRLAGELVEHGELNLGSPPSLFTIHPALVAVEVGCRLADRDLLESAIAHLQLIVDRGVLFGIEWSMSVHRALAQAAVALERHEDAVHLVDNAMAAARRAESPLEVARTQLVRAQLGVASGVDIGVVMPDVQAALAYFQDNQMAPFAEDARRVMPDAALGMRRDVVIVYTDLVESTRLNVSMGDPLFGELLQEHNHVVRERLRAFGGVEFTHTGDGVGARFSSVDAALEFSLGLQRRFDQLNVRHPEFLLNVRIGIARGDALELRNEGGNLFGLTVIRAVRICSHANSGQVLIGDDVLAHLDPATTQVRSVGRFPLKGLADHQELYEVTRMPLNSASAPATLPR
jgi:class 3 adenylate cyclase